VQASIFLSKSPNPLVFTDKKYKEKAKQNILEQNNE